VAKLHISRFQRTQEDKLRRMKVELDERKGSRKLLGGDLENNKPLHNTSKRETSVPAKGLDQISC
jgi:hypothetical protein